MKTALTWVAAVLMLVAVPIGFVVGAIILGFQAGAAYVVDL